MANRNFPSQRIFSFNVMPVMIHARASIGASGAPTLIAATSQGVKSIVRNSTGNYTITLQDGFNTDLHVRAQLRAVSATVGSGIMAVEVVSVTQANTGATINLICINAAGSLADPASGSQLGVLAIMSNSSLQ
jgi:hypothetical protein